MKESILKRYPGLTENDFSLRDDGEGVYIDIWNSEDSKPKMSDVISWVAEDENDPKPKTEVEALREENGHLNLAIIDLYEMLMG